jgi:hypothetical protein
MIFSLVQYERIRLPDYEYPLWAELIGWMLALSSMLCIPVYAVWKWVTTEGTNEEVNIYLLLLFIIFILDRNSICSYVLR